MSLLPLGKVAVVGLGLLGTSLGLALKNSGVQRLGWARRKDVRDWCLAHGAVDVIAENPADILRDADLTVICRPIPAINSFILEHAGDFKSGSIVTDIGSDKGVIVETGETVLHKQQVHFVGSHPMAGTEKNGCEAAFAELYDNAEIFVTVTPQSNPDAVDTVEAFWNLLPIAQVKRFSPEIHDSLVAHTSHISHLLALALTLSVLECNDSEEAALRYSGCATGFRDTSRIASSSPVMWREIIENNQPAVVEAARKCERIYHEIVTAIENGEFDRFEALFARGKELRDNWMNYKTLQKQRRGSEV